MLGKCNALGEDGQVENNLAKKTGGRIPTIVRVSATKVPVPVVIFTVHKIQKDKTRRTEYC